jgi:hypothetical protein
VYPTTVFGHVYIPLLFEVTVRKRNILSACVGKSHGQGSLERQDRREENIKMNLRQIGHDCVDWAEVTQEEIKWHTSEKAVIYV